MNKFVAINLIKNAEYRSTHINIDKTKTVTIRVGAVTVAVINETRMNGGVVWFVHLNASQTRYAENLQMAYAMALDDFIVAFEYQTDNIKVSNSVVGAPGIPDCITYTLYNRQTGMQVEYIKGQRQYAFKPAFQSYWQQGFDSLTVKKIELAIFIFENA